MSREGSKSLVRFAGEFVVIVVGVLVALGVDQWRQSVETRDLVEATLRQLAAEVAENDERLLGRLEYHTRILPSLDSLHDSVNAGNRVLISIERTLPDGLGIAPLRATAWDLASVTESARHFDLPLLSFLSTMYSVQEQLTETDRIINDGVIRPEWFGADVTEDNRFKAGAINRILKF